MTWSPLPTGSGESIGSDDFVGSRSILPKTPSFLRSGRSTLESTCVRGRKSDTMRIERCDLYIYLEQLLPRSEAGVRAGLHRGVEASARENLFHLC